MQKLFKFLILLVFPSMINCACTNDSNCVSTSTTPSCKSGVCSACVSDEDCLKNPNGLRCIKLITFNSRHNSKLP